jgi:hypothetical protein
MDAAPPGLLENLESEVQSGDLRSIKESILQYILADPAERARLRIKVSFIIIFVQHYFAGVLTINQGGRPCARDGDRAGACAVECAATCGRA